MPLKTNFEEQPTLNLTPMIDIVFLLIIFFMVGTKFTEVERQIGIKLPEVTDNGALTEVPAKKIVNVHADGMITLDRKTVSLAELTEKLREAKTQYSDLSVIVRGDGSASYEEVVRAFNACRQSGVVELGMSVRLATKTR